MTTPSDTIQQALQAIDVIVKDVDKKFDECLVEKFIDTMTAEIRVPARDPTLPADDCRTVDPGYNESTMAIIDRLKYYMDLDSFVMLNQARALKTFQGALRTQTLTENRLKVIEAHLQSFWNNIGTIIVNDNLDAMTVVISILEYLSTTTFGFRWLLQQKILPPVKFKDTEIKDTISMTSFYIETCKNYHTKHMAERLLKCLIINSIRFKPYLSSSQLGREAIRGLMLKCYDTTVHILNDIRENGCENYGLDEESLVLEYDINGLLEQKFSQVVEQPGPRMNNFCRCMAYNTYTQAEFDRYMNLLKSKGRLDGMIVYLTNCSFRHIQHSQLYANFVLYPILTSCKNDDEAELIVHKLLTTRDERDFVDRHRDSKLITLSIVQLSRSLMASKQASYLQEEGYPNNWLDTLTMNTLTCYIRYHISNSNNFRNLLEACSALDHLLSQPTMRSKSNVCNLIHGLLGIMSNTFPISNFTKPVVMSMIKLLQSAHRRFVRITPDNAMLVSEKLYDLTLELAFKTEDHDVLNEFMLHFIASKFVRYVSNKDKFLDFVYNHVHTISKETDHQELIGNLFVLMLEADLNIENEALERMNVTRHGIAAFAGDWLIEYSAVSPTVQLIVTNLYVNVHYMSHLTGGPSKEPCTFCTEPLKGLEKSMDKLAKGLCVTLKGECPDGSQLASSCLVERLIRCLIKHEEDLNLLFKRLLHTTIIETLYDIVIGSSFSKAIKRMAKRKVLSIKVDVLDKIDGAYERMLDELNNSFEAEGGNNHKVVKQGKAELITDFYRQASEELAIDAQWEDEPSDRFADGLSQTAKDILSFELLADGILDCY